MNLLYKLSCVFISSKVNVNTGTIFLISPCMQLIKEWCHLGIPISLLDNDVRETFPKLVQGSIYMCFLLIITDRDEIIRR